MKEKREPVYYRWLVVLPDSTLNITAESWSLLENKVLEFFNYGENFARYSVAVFAQWLYIENRGVVNSNEQLPAAVDKITK